MFSTLNIRYPISGPSHQHTSSITLQLCQNSSHELPQENKTGFMEQQFPRLPREQMMNIFCLVRKLFCSCIFDICCIIMIPKGKPKCCRKDNLHIFHDDTCFIMCLKAKKTTILKLDVWTKRHYGKAATQHQSRCSSNKQVNTITNFIIN